MHTCTRAPPPGVGVGVGVKVGAGVGVLVGVGVKVGVGVGVLVCVGVKVGVGVGVFVGVGETGVGVGVFVGVGVLTGMVAGLPLRVGFGVGVGVFLMGVGGGQSVGGVGVAVAFGGTTVMGTVVWPIATVATAVACGVCPDPPEPPPFGQHAAATRPLAKSRVMHSRVERFLADISDLRRGSAACVRSGPHLRPASGAPLTVSDGRGLTASAPDRRDTDAVAEFPISSILRSVVPRSPGHHGTGAPPAWP
jgi:hypothetical protein